MPTHATVTSSSGLCSLTLDKTSFEKDLVMQHVVKQIEQNHPLQVTVKMAAAAKGGAPYQFQMASHEPAVAPLTHRSAILRSLAGPALQYQLDTVRGGCLLGGLGSSASMGGASTERAMQRGELQAWMSVAESLLEKGATDVADDGSFLSRLEKHLSTRAFLVTSTSQPSLADLTLGAALLQTKADYTGHLNVARWMAVVYNVLQTNLGDDKVPSLAVPQPAAPVPIFFSGLEDIDSVLKKEVVASASVAPTGKGEAAAATAGGGGKGGDKQNQKQKQQQPKQPKEKAAKQQQQQQAAEPAEWTVAAIDLRVGQIVKCWPHESADKLYCEEIDFGAEHGKREIASGLRPFYASGDELVGKKVVVVFNLKKRTMLGFASHGMVLCTSNADHTQVAVIEPPAETPLGERLCFDGIEQTPAEPDSKVAKKKIWEAVAPDLKTNDQGQVSWKGAVAKTSQGVVTGKLPDAQVA